MTNDELNYYIKHYIEKDKTGRAIMLTGAWGTGKSYYIKNELKDYLEEYGCKCVVVSLYGLTDPGISSVFAVTFRIMSINIPILAVIYVMRTFFQATKQRWLANILVVLDGFATVVPLMYFLSKIDIYWLWA